MTHSRKSGLFCCLLLLLCGVQMAHAQDLSNQYINAAGNPNFSVNIPVENGYINVANGNLHLEFPLSNLKQRGALTAGEELVYDSRIWKINEDSGGYYWAPDNLPNTDGPENPGSANGSGWRFVSGNESGFLNTPTVHCLTNCGDWYYELETDQYLFTYTDSQGTRHTFDPAQWEWCTGCADSSQEKIAAVSNDGSGYTVQMTGVVNDVSTQVTTVFDSQGTQVYSGLWYGSQGPQLCNNSQGTPIGIDRYGNCFSSDADGNLIDDLGRTPVKESIDSQNSNVQYYDVLTIAGATKQYTITWEPISVSTNFNQPQSGSVPEWSGTLYAVQSIHLPDGSSYFFTYDTYGGITSITLPTGGTVNYGWTNFLDSYNNENRWLTSRALGTSTPTTFTPSVISNCDTGSMGNTGCQEQMEVVKPSGGETVYTLTLNNGAWNSYTSVGGVNISNTYNFANACDDSCTGSKYINKSLETTALVDVNLVAQRQYVYTNPQSGMVTKDQEWDYYSFTGSLPTAPPSSPATRETDYSYSSGSYPVCYSNVCGPWILQSKTQLDASQHTAAYETYNYTQGDVSPVISTSTGVTQHENCTELSCGPYLTSITKYSNASANPPNGPVMTNYAVYDTGMVQAITDPAGNQTTYGYDPTETFVTSVTRPSTNGIHHVSYFAYDPSSGLLKQKTDENNQITRHSYYESGTNLGKPSQDVYPDGGANTYTYPSSTEVDTATLQNSTTTINSSKTVDAYGRSYQAVQSGISTETTYDGNGRVFCITNPHTIGTSSSTDGSTCYTYDSLDRVTIQTKPDSNSVHYSYSGDTVTVTDESGNQKKYQYDAFHDLTSVAEPDSTGALKLETDYAYNGLGNLLTVNQKGNGTTDAPRSRTFTYDSLSRLLKSTTPEAGAITYSYLNAGAPCAGDPTLPCSKTDNRQVTTNYSYDVLNRLLSKTYSSNAPAGSLSSCYAYDTATNGIGRLGAEWTTASSCSTQAGYQTLRTYVAYDLMGRLWNEQQCAFGNCTTGTSTPPCKTSAVSGISFCYDLAGNQTFSSSGLNSPSYLSGSSAIAQTNTYDNANRINSITSNWNDSTHPPILFMVSGYAPPGELQNYTLGTGIDVNQTYDDRLRTTGETATQQ